MTLRDRLLLTTLVTVVSLIAVTGAALWVVSGMAGNLWWVAEEYDELRLIDHVGNDLATARSLLQSQRPDFELVADTLDQASSRLETYLAMQLEDEDELSRSALDHQDAERRTGYEIARALKPVMDHVRAMSAPAVDGRRAIDPAVLMASVEQTRIDLEELAAEADDVVLYARQKSQTALRRSVLALTGLCLAAALVGVISGLVQYRSVVPPLARMRDRVREIASGKFDQRLEYHGKDEFADLAADFNRMVAELEALYNNLEQRVEVKSRQLVRSERLASAGYLAAGVAHEINNPLSIIAGHAELALKDIRKRFRGPEDADSIQGLEIIRDEAFRCKQITEKLLSLIRNPDAPHAVVGLGPLAHEVASMVLGLKQFRGRTLDVQIDPDQPLKVVAHEAEMKQVLLNLTINAMEAVSDTGGRVQIVGRESNGEVELSVIDNGHGMTTQVLSRAFEPFYTEKRGADERGNGLGLSIVHAIIQDHGGSIEAHSDGLGRGSRLTFRLPAARDQEHHDRCDTNQSVA